MEINEEQLEDLLIDKCLIIDNKFEEVRDIIFDLNKHAISTDYRDDVLLPGVKIDPNTQLVILDLYMSENQNSLDKALESVGFLNNHIKGPFFLLIWTKHKDKFRDFVNQLEEKYIRFDNFPLDIQMLTIDKIEGEQNEERVADSVKEIITYIYGINDKFTNINSYIRMTKIFQEQSSMFWKIFKPRKYEQKDTSKILSNHYEKILGQAFYSFDKAFNYEKSGKGFLDIHARFLENELTLNHLDYSTDNDGLDEKLKEEINSKLIIHSFNNKSIDGMPGLIYRLSDDNFKSLEKLLRLFVPKEEFDNGSKSKQESNEVYLDSFKIRYFKLRNLWKKVNASNNNFKYSELLSLKINEDNRKKVSGHFEEITTGFKIDEFDSVRNIINKQFMDNVQFGNLIITPYCDFANNKKDGLLYLPVMIVSMSKSDKKSIFKKNIELLDLHNGKLLLYNPSTYCVRDLVDLKSKTYNYYISKEYVNEIQINVANSISRIGTTIIE